jgi:hypothetical protein
MLKEGTNGRSGTATLAAGTVTVSNTTITALSRVFLTSNGLNGSTAIGTLDVTKINGTGFTINSYSAAAAIVPTDTRIVQYLITEGG